MRLMVHTGKQRWRQHSPAERCAFCQQLDLIYSTTSDWGERERLITELFDRADRARLTRQAYGHRHGYTR